MKKLCNVFILVYVFTINAQTSVYHPFPTSNAIWNEELVTGIGCPVWHPRTVKINNDTIINLMQYHKLYATGNSHTCNTGPANQYTDDYIGAIREDISQKQVFYYPESDTGEYLLYDFNLNIGDTLPVQYNNTYGNIVYDIDSILLGSTYRKRFILQSTTVDTVTFAPDTSYALIEGIGSTLGLVYEIVPFFEGGSYIVCFTDLTATYSSDGFGCNYTVGINDQAQSNTQIFPNPAGISFFIKLAEEVEKGQIKITNELGQQIFQQQFIGMQVQVNTEGIPAGIYFITVTDHNRIVSREKVILSGK